MPPILRNGSFLFVLQSQPFYQAQLVPVTTISILGSLAQFDGEAACLSHAVHRRSLKWGLVYEEWMDKGG